MVAIKGLEKFAPRDFPGYLASTVFIGGCNFRCPYCHNADLVLRPDSLPSFPMDFFLGFLESRKEWIEAVCVTGGEPLMHEDLEVLLRLIKERDLLVKIDTNGSFPARLETLMQDKLVDYVAMDVKAPLEKYPDVTLVPVSSDDIQNSISLIMQSNLSYLFRTTVVPGLVGGEDIQEIAQLLKGARVFQIQRFVPNNTLDKDFENKKPFSIEEVKSFAELAKPYFSEVRIEGV
ncbi:anaerobic ribonucleoside-triphosphate reductase activating protein [Acidobacteriota bacterium]